MNKSQSTNLQPVPMLDFSRHYAMIREDVLAAIAQVCDSQRFILGPEVATFERSLAGACQVPFAIGCASGTDALWLALAALKIGPGDAVITTPFSFFATASSILRCGATPILADIDERTFNLDAAKAERAANDGNVRALMPVHLYGQCADMDALGGFAKSAGIALVEDAAQAFGATWNGVPAGALGDAGCFSFYPTKNLSAFGEGGLVTTHDATLAERMTMLRAHGMRQRYFHDEVGWNSRLDTLQAAVLEVKLRYVPEGNRKRQLLAARYDELFRSAALAADASAEGVVLPYTDPRAGHVFHQYVIRVPRRDELRRFLSEQQIGTEVYYPLPLHQQKSLLSLGYSTGDFPVSERAASEVMALPMYPELREDEQDTVVEAIRSFYA